MLVLSRKLHEQIQIGDNVTITVLRIKGNTVRIGIDAPQEVRVVRGELPPLRQIKEVAVYRSHPQRNEVIEIASSDLQESALEQPAAERNSSHGPSGTAPRQSNDRNGLDDRKGLPGIRVRPTDLKGVVPPANPGRLHDLVQAVTGTETPLG